MKVQTKVFLVVACLILAIPMIAGAQRYKGDGATQNPTSGYWDQPAQANHVQCLECHGTVPYHSAPDKSSYLLTGHRNLLRKVIPGQPWAGPEGIYEEDIAFNIFDWTNGNIIIDGTPHKMFYVMGDWMAPEAIAIYDKNNDGTQAWTTEDEAYGTCARCHVTGYNSVGATEPQATYPTITSGITGKWWFDGVQCERCHRDSMNDVGGHNCYVNNVLDPTITSYSACGAAGGKYQVNVATGSSSTVLCGECHLAAAGWEGAANPKKDTQPTAYPLRASVTGFSGHVVGKEFLNSPHGKFSGTINQITNASLYSSHFSEGTCSVAGEYFSRTTCQAAGGTWTTTGPGGCTTCHDAHESTVPAIKETFGAEPMKNACGIACHVSQADFTKINHPSGTGTPMDGSVTDACVSCHMPKVPGATRMMHIFRISTDPSYSTLPKAGATTPGICSNPVYTNKTDCTANGYCSDAQYTTKTDCQAAGKTWTAYAWYVVANSAPDGDYANAIWIDVDLACGKCHGGGADGSGAIIYPLTKTQLAEYAIGMHAGVSPNAAPVVADAASITINGMTATLVDNSTCIVNGRAQHPQSELEVTINWGDWSVSKGKGGQTFTHNYNKKGKFKITHTVKEPHGLKDGHKEKIVIK